MFKKKKEKKVVKDNKPVIKDLAREYLAGVNKLSQSQKICKLYQDIYDKKPDVNLNPNQILNRLLYRNKFGKYIKDTDNFLKVKKKKFKWSMKIKNVFKKSKKKRNQILVWFLNIKGEIELPKLYPIYSSNMVIIQNRPYEVDPRSFWKFGKYSCQIIKGIDRRPVSNLDYNEIKKRGDATDSDEFLIKAALSAVQQDKVKKPIDKKIIIIMAIAAAAALIYFMSA